LRDPLQCRFANRRTPKVRMQDYAGGVDDRTQRICELRQELLFDGGWQQRDRSTEFSLVERRFRNPVTEPRDSASRGFEHHAATESPGECLELRLLQQLVDGRQQPEQVRIIRLAHRSSLILLPPTHTAGSNASAGASRRARSPLS